MTIERIFKYSFTGEIINKSKPSLQIIFRAISQAYHPMLMMNE